MCLEIYLLASTHEDQRKTLNVLDHSLTYSSEAGSPLNLGVFFSFQPGWWPASPRDLLVFSPHSTRVTSIHETLSSFLCICWNPNTDPHSGIASLLKHVPFKSFKSL